MADSKITALTALTAADPVNDMFPVVDVSDTTMAASGTTKKISVNNILGASGTATLASATITGDLTVDTSTLKVDSTNNRVGIVQATPLYPLHLVGEFGLEEASSGNGTKLRLIGDASKYNFRLGKQLTATNTFEITPSTAIGGTTFSNPVYTVTYDGTHTFLDGTGGTRMTLNSTGLGVGGSPVTSHLISAQGPIAIGGTAGGTRTSYISNSGAASIYYTDGGASYPFNEFGNLVIQPRTSAARSVVIATGSTTPVERAVVKSTGQVRFVPLAADPSGAEAGDVYYNSTSNKLKCYNGSTWNDLF
jgi:hypothetical protein